LKKLHVCATVTSLYYREPIQRNFDASAIPNCALFTKQVKLMPLLADCINERDIETGLWGIMYRNDPQNVFCSPFRNQKYVKIERIEPDQRQPSRLKKRQGL
jgi:hypothetical protein